MMKKYNMVLPLLLLALFLLPRAARAGEATEVLRADIDRTLSVMRDPALQGPEKEEERNEKIMAIVEQMFDFEEVSRRSLGRYWRARSKAERDAFVRLFTRLLAGSYLNRAYEHRNAKVLYTGEVSRGRKVEVRTKVLTAKGTEVPINYRLMKKNGRWRAYDMVIEGVSLMSTYRTQFNQKIQRSSYEALVEDLEQKVGKK
ncbi:MAG: phospholipid-binding protein MlaC [Thermodesulfobacteriota bacterium]